MLGTDRNRTKKARIRSEWLGNERKALQPRVKVRNLTERLGADQDLVLIGKARNFSDSNGEVRN